VIYLSAGHSNADPGAAAFGRREADIAVEFRNMVAFYLRRAKVPHDVDGHGQANASLRDTVRVTTKRDGVELEFHCNAGPTQATGVETLSGPKDMALAGKICEAIAGALEIRNRGAKPENAGQHHRLAFVQAGGIIVELFFLTNPDDLAAYDAHKWLAARAVADILIEGVPNEKA
jgi:N-acetylmuramoyl-L-alanine amidase